MVRSLETIDLMDGFQPAIDLRERATDDENGCIVCALVVFGVCLYFILRLFKH